MGAGILLFATVAGRMLETAIALTQGVAQIVQVFQERSTLAFEELDATNSSEGSVMPTDAFDCYVRQSMEVDFEQFIDPLEKLPRKVSERSGVVEDESGSVVGELDQAALLQALDEQMRQHPEWTEAEAFNQAMSIAHDEDVSTWAGMIQSLLTRVPNYIHPACAAPANGGAVIRAIVACLVARWVCN